MPVHFSEAIPQIIKKAEDQKFFLCLDFDGTLVPIRRDPQKVRLSKALINFLHRACLSKSFEIAIISGRQLKDIKGRIKFPKVILVGSHGLEWNIDEKRDAGRAAKLKRVFVKWKKSLNSVKGVHFENKPFSFVLHYRRCSRGQQKRVINFFQSHAGDLLQSGFDWTVAHKAFEVFAANRGRKEQVCRQLMGQYKGDYFITAGDDVTDFEMLKLGNRFGLAVSVGGPKSGIKYFAQGPGDFIRCLNRLVITKNGHRQKGARKIRVKRDRDEKENRFE